MLGEGKNAAVPALGDKEQADVAAIIRPYGVGIDCHSKFIAVCVLVLHGGEVLRHEQQFDVSQAELIGAREWASAILFKYGVWDGILRYVLESTGCYHYPVIHAFAGRPCVVNPMLTGPYRRKTDTLDARVLAYHGMTGLWPESYFPDAPAWRFVF